MKSKPGFFLVPSYLMVLLALGSSSFGQGDRVDALIQSTMKAFHIPGLQVAVISKGQIIKLAAYGKASVEFNVPVTNKTVFAVNSITKAFTGIALMQLVEEKKLSLEAPVSTYLDSLPIGWQGITISQLASHMSGLPDIVDGNFKLIGPGSEEAAWNLVRNLPVEFLPGDRFRYNTLNYVLLGMVIHKLSGKPFTQFVQEKQFNVAGMAQAAYHDSRDVFALYARTYTFLQFVDGNIRFSDSMSTRYEEFPTLMRTAAGITCSAEALAHWIIAIQQHKLLTSPESLIRMWTPAIGKDGKTAGFSDVLNGYGIGWPIVTRAKHHAFAAIGGERSALFIYPDDNLSIVVLTNLMGASPQGFIDKIAANYFK